MLIMLTLFGVVCPPPSSHSCPGINMINIINIFPVIGTCWKTGINMINIINISPDLSTFSKNVLKTGKC